MATLSRDDVAHVAYLARLGLTDEELSPLEGQLHHLLEQYANHALHAWLTIDRERALDEADAADARLAAARAEGVDAAKRLHPLLGIPVALKDLVSIAGGQATAGSRILDGYRSPYDAHITERLRDAGAVVLGKTNMDEFAMGSSTEHSAYGPTSTPWALAPVPVPDELLALPASNDEAAAWLRGRRLGLPKEYFVAGMEPGVEERVREGVAALEGAGARVEEVSLPHTDYGLATYYIVAPAEASANLARYDGIRFGPRLGEGDMLSNYLATRGRGFGPEVKRRIMLGTYALSAGYYDAFYVKAQKGRTLIKDDFDKAFADVDVIAAPTAPRAAFPIGEKVNDPLQMYLEDVFTL